MDWLEFPCPACGAGSKQPCKKNNGSIRKRPHGPRRQRFDRDWPGSHGQSINHPKGWWPEMTDDNEVTHNFSRSYDGPAKQELPNIKKANLTQEELENEREQREDSGEKKPNLG